MQILNKTRSVCPHCLKNIEAEIIENNDEIQIHKTCPEHGDFKSVIWRSLPKYTDWIQLNSPLTQQVRARVQEHKNCPNECGLCGYHSQKTCSLLLELCQECNLHCPICFANSSKETQKENAQKSNTKFQDINEVKKQIDFLHSKASKAILQLSGGEPTLYPELIDVVRYANPLFSAVQLNTNGLLLAKNPLLAQQLKEAGLSWVFLQFDGIDNKIHKAMRGNELQEIKEKAIENCKKAGLSLVLVCTIVDGINDHCLGDLIDFSLSHFPSVRGLHLQPMTFSGRNSFAKSKKHITLPEVVEKLSTQSKGRIKIEDALPSSCEHSLCSFHCRYYVKENQELEYIHQHNSICACEDIENDDAPKRSIEMTIKSWKSIENTETSNINSAKTPINIDSFDAFIKRAKTKIPFCAYNLTSLDGKSIYRL